MDKSDRIGLFGGTFDPIHNAHLQMALCAKQQFNLDRVYFITANNSPFKIDKVILDAETRHNLVELAVQQYPGLYASRAELDREGISYSYQSLEIFQKEFPQAKFFWIMGADAFKQIDQWQNFQYLKEHLHFLVFARGDNRNINPQPDINYYLVQDFDAAASSTKIRKIINENNPEEIITLAKLNKLVPDIILEKVIKSYSSLKNAYSL